MSFDSVIHMLSFCIQMFMEFLFYALDLLMCTVRFITYTTVGHINNNIYILHAIYNYQTGWLNSGW